MCVYICVRAELFTCMRVCVRARTCVNARACTFSHVRVFLCVHLCTQVCMHVCVRLQGCVNADVRACGGGCMHICVEECACVVSGPASSPPGNLQWGWLACTANTQTLVLLVLLLLNPLLSNHWLLLDHHGFTSTRDTASNITKTIVKICPDAGLWIFVVSKASGRSLSTTHSGRIYTYLYGKTVYIRIIRRIYTPAKIHIIRIRVRRKFIYTYVYIRYVFIRRIYTYTVWANPTYICSVYDCIYGSYPATRR